jgi:hypothetical protein
MFDRLVCMSGGNPRPDLIDKKSTLKAQALEKSLQWQELTRNHLEGRTAAFFCYGNLGANELDGDNRPKILRHKEWFAPSEEPYQGGEREAYQGLVWQCRFSGIEVPDHLWQHASIGLNRPYADDQAEDMMSETEALACLDAWVTGFITYVRAKGLVPGTAEAEKGAKSTTNV